jgi:hypothetical protein
MPLKNPVIFAILVLAVLLGASIATYVYGLPLLQSSQLGCQGADVRSFGCSTSFGTFIIWITIVVGLAIGAIWSKFGRQ